MAQYIFVLIICILIIDFALERVLAFLNIRHSRLPLPSVLSDVFDAEKYQLQQHYFRINSRFGMITASFSFILMSGMVVFGGFGYINNLLVERINNPYILPMAFFGLIFLLNDLLTLPFNLYDTFGIEQKFGFNKVTPRLFVIDKLKGYLLTVIIGGGLLYAVLLIYYRIPEYFWVVAWLVITLFGLIMSMFYSELIVPLFNKQTPLEPGELRDKIENFANKTGFRLNNIYVIDGSKRSTKANAYFSGLGPKKRIVLYDTLMDKLTTNEIVAVLAHEIGHYKFKHSLKGMLVSIPSSLLLFFLFGLMLKNNALAQAMGSAKASFQLNALAFSLLYSPVSLVIDLAGNILSRKFEYQADAFAANQNCGPDLASGLKKLSATSLSNLMPHPAYVFFHYSHPALYQRLNKILNK